tara:strand:+ start:90739 stop:90882 length:144 start_codon:yes stop_codon:yes gene_type:complete
MQLKYGKYKGKILSPQYYATWGGEGRNNYLRGFLAMTKVQTGIKAPT